MDLAHIGFASVSVQTISRLAATAMFPARRIASFLQTHVIVEQVEDDLNMTLRLHPAPHKPEAEPRLIWTGLFSRNRAHLTARHIFLEREGRNDGVERAFAWLKHIWMLRVEAEQLAAILEHEAKTICDQAGSHAAIV